MAYLVSWSVSTCIQMIRTFIHCSKLSCAAGFFTRREVFMFRALRRLFRAGDDTVYLMRLFKDKNCKTCSMHGARQRST